MNFNNKIIENLPSAVVNTNLVNYFKAKIDKMKQAMSQSINDPDS